MAGSTAQLYASMQVDQARNSQLYVKSLGDPAPFETFEEDDDIDVATPALLKA